MDGYITAFDLIVHPERIAPLYGVFALFLFAGLATLFFGLFIRRSVWMIVFAAVFLSFTSVMAFQDITHALNARGQVSRGEYQTIEGCLDYFHPGAVEGGRTIAGDEIWAVAGRQFRYGENQVRFAYHLVEPRGGVVHAYTMVRVSYVTDDFLGRDDIVRLQVRQHACPSAPDVLQ